MLENVVITERYHEDAEDGETGTSLSSSIPGLGKRLGMVIDRIGIDKSVQAVGKSAKSLDRYVKGKEPPIGVVARLAEASGVPVQWFFADEDEVRLPVVQQSAGELLPPDVILIPRLDISAAAGAGAYVEGEQTLEYIALPEPWLRKRGVSPKAARVLTAKGDSMEPTIRDGDVLIVDTSFDRVIDNAIYVLMVSNRLLLKRIHVLISGALQLISDNPIYPQEDVPADGADFLQVAGRVMWFGRGI